MAQPGREDLGRGHFNDIAFRLRMSSVPAGRARKGVVAEAKDMMDYDLGLFEATATLTVPLPQPAPGDPHRARANIRPSDLNGRTAKTCDACCSLTLPAGDYKVTVELRRVDGKNSNITGKWRR